MHYPYNTPVSCETEVWALPVSLAATQGISSVSVPLATEMFHFARYTSACADTLSSSMWVAPFGDLRIAGCSTPPRSLSQSHRVLHRYCVSRHPSRALEFLFSSVIWCVYNTASTSASVIQCNLIPILSKTTAVSGRGMSLVVRETSLDYHRPAPLNSNKNAALAAVAGCRTWTILTHAPRRLY